VSGIIVCRHRADEDYRKIVACRFQVCSLINFSLSFSPFLSVLHIFNNQLRVNEFFILFIFLLIKA